MPWVVPSALETAVYAAAERVVGRARLATPSLVAAITDRSRRYTSEREALGRPADPDGDLAARAVFFTIADALKIAVPLDELAARDALPARRPLRVVDLGAGCGAMTLGLAATCPELALDVLAIDRDPRALEIARLAVQAFAPAATIATRTADATRAELPAADLVVIGNMLNELSPAHAIEVVGRALAAIADDGAVIVIEPALRDTARGLHAIRDAVIARGLGHVAAPCTRHGAPCPALADPGDWCHEDRALQLSPRTAELARLTHLRDSGMKFAYLVLRRAPLDLVAAGDRAWRIVSAPIPAKGKLEIFGCSAHGRVPLRLLKRHRSADNRALERVDRGDVVVVDDAPDDARVEIRGPVTVVTPRRDRS
ncbi:MAG TPA: small ribosomal subunit Rsm22 family protein [Kofleriaceae bacterium]|nr:small ribosomal subunit Rsm22 family protein [Kofleriaceae bacterium]